MKTLPEFIETSHPRSFCETVLTHLSQRDRADLTRINVKIGDVGLLRYTAARYMSPMFVEPKYAKIYKAFGEKVEAAYQEMVEAIRAADTR